MLVTYLFLTSLLIIYNLCWVTFCFSLVGLVIAVDTGAIEFDNFYKNGVEGKTEDKTMKLMLMIGFGLLLLVIAFIQIYLWRLVNKFRKQIPTKTITTSENE